MPHDRTDYAAAMRKRGHRVTPQRQLILDAICQAGGHTTPEEIYGRVHARQPGVNRATVYRNLDFLCDMRLVVAAEAGRGRKVYEIAGETPHHHLVCRTCGRSTQIGHHTVEAFFASIELEQQFKVDMNHLALFGLCPACAGKAAGRA